ncbi:glucose 1-dehydrogenase [Pseudomonas synxantha]|uniref:Glucose 1-dehydrogenase n=1 Tax=Pseudomonas synxantha TaxID=47883 RepID=A0ABS0UC35_9PSED|nr:glucose 1-dehydrogenase [Pseudomonas synxantha]MBI6563159.1 glucose 1-dehydrogenase [Pseudomonas synxantha]MBI6583397.1 glucose 1-dehydrogenase [Pseudomonas synxantha]MBI6646767.1 glucose 1-dehydrogenase [Pseudomonas synxantha]
MSSKDLPNPYSLVNLVDQVVLITGAASGIGRAQVELFLAAGASIVAVDINPDGLERLKELGEPARQRLQPQIADLSKAEDIVRVVNSAIERFGRIDVLCNTAGLLDGYKPSLDVDEALWDKIFAVNIKGLYRLTNAVLPGMLAMGKGVIINMASVAGNFAGGGGAAYTATKHAVLGYTRQLSYDYGRKGIRVNAVCPGMIETGMTADALSDRESKLLKVLTSVPAGRLGKPEDIAQISLFLAGQGADFIHGAAITVDGGLTIK